MTDERHAAWAELSAVLPDGWIAIGPVWRKDERDWAVYARRTIGARRDGDEWREAFGESEAMALRALAQQFRTAQA